MLERDSGRPRLRSTHYVWYGAGGVLAVVLVASLVTLARGNGGTRQVEPIVVAATEPAGAAPHTQLTAATQPAEPRPAPAGESATIVDETQASAPASTPPLVLLSAAEASAASASAPAAETAPPGPGAAIVEPAASEAASAAASASAAVQKETEHVTRSERAEHSGRSERAQSAAKRVPTKAPAAHEDARRTRKAAQARPAGARRIAHTRAKKQPRPAAAPEPVDSDVALISAVIMHGTKRSNAGEPPCAGTNCAAKATAQQ